jgi:DtxR family Mn-dependent transcriptional regulator
LSSHTERADGHLSENVEMYLKTILLLELDSGAPPKTGDISKELKVSPAAVTEMLVRLQKDGLVRHEKYKGTQLTKDGNKRARDIMRKHCVMERFLVETLDMGSVDFHDQACKLEHVVSDEMAQRMGRLSKIRPECPECYDLKTKHCENLAV